METSGDGNMAMNGPQNPRNGSIRDPAVGHSTQSTASAGASSVVQHDQPTQPDTRDASGGGQASEENTTQHKTITRTSSAPPSFGLAAQAQQQNTSLEQANVQARSQPIHIHKADARASQSMSAVPIHEENQTNRIVVKPPQVERSEQATPRQEQPHEMTKEAFDEFINSPRAGENAAIVERSPGGRYVRFHEKLGSGASKDVFRAYDTQEGIEVAWNVVNLSGVPKTERNRIVNEVRLLERLHHHNIISFHGSWVNRERQEVNFVTEILSSGTLKSFIDKVQVIRWKIAKRWARQILKGLEYLHSQEPPVIHRDLKCENIFINGTSGDLRIGDLGLSTVHRNGQVLSVLGTPEFMAPDLYEESAYDEKVDIYAFGMCLLEIFTKEIPYRECTNPAQIYKKVMRGELPQSLQRLKSRHGREFIMLCLGSKGEDGKYIRPSATELLQHKFLQKHPDDELEVELEPTLQERRIDEAPPDELASKGNAESVSEVPPMPRSRRQSSSVDDDGDRFEEMPDSEVNMKKVKVLMGRGQELEEDESSDFHDAEDPLVHEEQERFEEHPLAEHQNMVNGEKQAPPTLQISAPVAAPVPGPSPAAPQPAAEILPTSQAGPPPPMTTQPVSPPVPPSTQEESAVFCVAAAVIEDESPDVRPYADDNLKLIITLTVDGEPQNVQFDFHLVEDDPVQVAKEMVDELGIPKEAVLEIGGTISALARQARIRQDKYINTHRQKELPPASQNQPPTTQPPQPGSLAVNVPVQHPQQLSQPMAVPEGQPSSQVQVPSHVHTMESPNSTHTSTASQPQLPHVKNVFQPPQHQPHTAPVAAPIQHQPAHQVAQAETVSRTLQDSVGQQVPSSQPNQAQQHAVARHPAGEPTSQTRDDDDDDDDEEVDEDIRRLDEDFQKNMMRAKKVFDSRMDSLHRTKQEKEAQHQKTLEKHEKERMEYEKRLMAEAKEQSRRMEELQKEWDRRRESLAKHKQGKKPPLGGATASLPNSPAQRVPPPPLATASGSKPIPQHPNALPPPTAKPLPTGSSSHSRNLSAPSLLHPIADDKTGTSP